MGSEETSVKSLLSIMYSTKTMSKPLPGSTAPSSVTGCSYDRSRSQIDCDEVFPNLYVGDIGAAQSLDYLTQLGITHVLNTAEGKMFGMVDTDAAFYGVAGIKYKGLSLIDLPITNFARYFTETTDFIDEGIKSGGKVLVNCLMGMSRSSTCALAYLMLKEGMDAGTALKSVKENRDVRPNVGFLKQLADLDNDLKSKRRLANHL